MPTRRVSFAMIVIVNVTVFNMSQNEMNIEHLPSLDFIRRRLWIRVLSPHSLDYSSGCGAARAAHECCEQSFASLGDVFPRAGDTLGYLAAVPAA